MSLWSGLKAIYRQMSQRRRRQLYFVQILMLAGAIAELATIGAVVPFLALLAGDGHSGIGSRLLSQLSPHGVDPALFAAAVFILTAVIAGIIRIQLAWSSRSFIFGCGHELSVEIQRRVLLQPYTFHIHRNSSTLLAALDKIEGSVIELLLPLMQAISGAAIAVFVIAVLIAINPIATCSAIAAFAAVYVLASRITRSRLGSNSDDVNLAFGERTQIVQESLGGIREVIVDSTQPVYLRLFATVDARLARARVTNQFIATAPRYVAEMVGMIVIATIALVASRHGGLAAALPLLGALALGGQRLLPLIQQIYAGWASVAAHRSVFDETIALLQLRVPPTPSGTLEPLPLDRAINVEDVSFTYPTRTDPALTDISLQIPRGAMIALQGPTGSGKSTLLDLLMGLLLPETGRILIDDVELGPDSVGRWHRSVAHVPQSIFLADTSIAANIALSLPEGEPDHGRIVEAAKLAQLHDFIVSLPAGYETHVGERGIRLSGGQRQRLGIARAVYKDTPILVFDEATSALDDATEAAVIEAFDELKRAGRTVIIVAHRRSTVRHCDIVVRVEHGRLVGPESAAPAPPRRSNPRAK